MLAGLADGFETRPLFGGQSGVAQQDLVATQNTVERVRNSWLMFAMNERSGTIGMVHFRLGRV